MGNDEMSPLITEGRAMLEGVTAGEWTVEYKHGTTRLMMSDICQMCDETYYPWTPENDKDWHFIAWARNNVPKLLDALEKAETARDIALARVKRLEEVTHPDFIFGAMDNVNDMDVSIDDFAQAVSREQRAALQEDKSHE